MSAPRAGGPGQGRERQGSREKPKPTPARASGESTPDTAQPTPPLPSERVDRVVDGVRWSVEVVGRAHGPWSGGTPALLLLRFVRGDREGPGLSAWVVGTGLDDVPQHTIEAALQGARDWTERDSAPGFFADLGDKGR